jgi:hypothetical protein
MHAVAHVATTATIPAHSTAAAATNQQRTIHVLRLTRSILL